MHINIEDIKTMKEHIWNYVVGGWSGYGLYRHKLGHHSKVCTEGVAIILFTGNQRELFRCVIFLAVITRPHRLSPSDSFVVQTLTNDKSIETEEINML